MAIDWNAIYEEELNRIPDTSDQLRKLQQQDIAALDTQRGAQESALRKQLSDAMRQAYITREMNRRDLPAIMSNMGLTGGITETAANDLLRDYRNTRNTANRSFTDSQTSLANTYNTNLASLNSDYGQRILDAMAQRRNEATNNANLRYQIAEAERQYQLQQEQWKWQQQQAAQAQAAARGASSGGVAAAVQNAKSINSGYPNTGGSGAQGQAYTGKVPGSTYVKANPGTYTKWIETGGAQSQAYVPKKQTGFKWK
jgi:hypothetical protein